MIDFFLSHYNYWAAVMLMMIGFYAVITRRNLIKKLIGLSIFQVSVLLFYISLAVLKDGSAPIYKPGVTLYHNPLPHVLMLTAIVVGIATLAVGLAIAVRIRESFGTLDESELLTACNNFEKSEVS